jgi:peptide/nickel transport system substrate-binding protein
MCDQFPPQGYNWSYFCDRRIDALEHIALNNYDVNTRRQAYWKIQQLLAEDVPVVFLSWVDIVHATRVNVRDFRPGETWWASWNWRKE